MVVSSFTPYWQVFWQVVFRTGNEKLPPFPAVVSIITHPTTFKAGGDIHPMCAPSYEFRNTGEEVEKNYLLNKSFKYE